MRPSVTITFPDWVEYDDKSHVASVDTHKAYPYWLTLLHDHYSPMAEDLPEAGEKKQKALMGDEVLRHCLSDKVLGYCDPDSPSAYWVEVAHLCCRLEIYRLCNIMFGRMPNVIRFRDPANDEGERRFTLKKLPGGDKGEDQLASKGMHARYHYENVKGTQAAATAGIATGVQRGRKKKS